MRTAIKHTVSDRIKPSFVIFERQSARMSKVTNDDLTPSGTGCFIAVHIWQQWVSDSAVRIDYFSSRLLVDYLSTSRLIVDYFSQLSNYF